MISLAIQFQLSVVQHLKRLNGDTGELGNAAIQKLMDAVDALYSITKT